MNFTSQLVQDVFHQQYHQNDNISSTKNKNIHSTWESRISWRCHDKSVSIGSSQEFSHRLHIPSGTSSESPLLQREKHLYNSMTTLGRHMSVYYLQNHLPLVWITHPTISTWKFIYFYDLYQASTRKSWMLFNQKTSERHSSGKFCVVSMMFRSCWIVPTLKHLPLQHLLRPIFRQQDDFHRFRPGYGKRGPQLQTNSKGCFF